MNANIIKVAAGVAWAGVAVSSAPPANASILTYQQGDYALCSSSYSTYQATDYTCNVTMNYTQQIKLGGQPCNSGACADSGTVYTQYLYGSGRAPTTRLNTCSFGNLYGVGSCSC
jgi:hypothetical protein